MGPKAKSYLTSIFSKYKGPILLCCFVLIANGLYLTGIFNANPINRDSGLLVQYTRSFGGLNTIDPNDGITTQALGHGAAAQLVHGHLPWWNYDEQVGAPLAGEMQSAALFPLTLLMELGNGILYFHIVLEAIAGIATYYLLRRLRCGEKAAIVGGMLFAVNGTFAWLTNAVFNPIAFLPLLLLGIEIAYDRAVSRQPRGWFLIALSFALSCYAGFPEVTYLNALLAAGWVGLRLFQARNSAWKQFLQKSMAGFGVGLLLAAPILVAFLDYYKYADIGVHSGAVAKAALTLAGLPALVFPYMYGPIFAAGQFDQTGTLTGWWSNVGGFLTLPLLLMAILGVVTRGNRYVKVYLLGWIGLAVARVYGFPGLYHIFNLIPGMSDVAVYRYLQPSFELATVILAAFGVEGLLHRSELLEERRKRAIAVWLGISLAAVALAVWSRKFVLNAPHHWLLLGGSIFWGITASVFILILARRKDARLRFLCLGILVLDSLLMFVIPQLSAFRSATLDTKPVAFLQTHLGESRFYTLGPIQPNYGTYYNIASIDTNDLPIAAHWAKYITTNLDPSANPILFTGAHTSGATIAPDDVLWKNLDMYRYTGVRYIVAGHDQIPLAEAQAHMLKQVYSDQTAAIFQIPNPAPYYAVLSGRCRVTSTDKTRAQAICTTPGSLLRRELFVPGWSATVDGRLAAVRQDGPLFQSINLSPGRHIIRFYFLPPYMKLAAVLLLAGCVTGVIFYRSVIGRALEGLLYQKQKPQRAR